MISHYNNYLKNKKLDIIDKNYIKYLKYKTKYQLLKEQIHNQNGGESLGFYINIKNTTDSFGNNQLKYKKIELEDPLIIKELQLIKYNEKIIYENTKKIHMILERYFFDAHNHIVFTIDIYEDINDLILTFNINTTEKFIIKFKYLTDFNFTNFIGKLRLDSITLPNSLKSQIKIELNDDTLDIKGVGFGFNIDFDVLNFNSFIETCYNLFIKINDIPNNFIQLRLDIQKLFSSTSCNNDKIFGEFIINHYLHNLYSKIGPAVDKYKSAFYYLMTKSGYKLLVKILTDLINNDIDDNSSKKIDNFCNNKNSYYHNVMKFLKTNLDLSEIEFKNHITGEWKSLPTHFTFTSSTIMMITPKLILDTGNSSKTIVGYPLLEYLGIKENIKKCVDINKCVGVGGEKSYTDFIDITLRFPYYNNIEFNVECLVDTEESSSLYNTFLFGWKGLLKTLEDNGYAIYGEN